jgi:hypothetical protein
LRPRYVVRTPRRFTLTGSDPEEDVVIQHGQSLSGCIDYPFRRDVNDVQPVNSRCNGPFASADGHA